MAPNPAASIARKQEIKAAKATMSITMRGETRTIAMDNVPGRERLLVRQETGKPWEAFRVDFGVDSLQVIWWIAGRLNGHPKLTLDEVFDSWPDGLTDDDIKVDHRAKADSEADDPEA